MYGFVDGARRVAGPTGRSAVLVLRFLFTCIILAVVAALSWQYLSDPTSP